MPCTESNGTTCSGHIITGNTRNGIKVENGGNHKIILSGVTIDTSQQDGMGKALNIESGAKVELVLTDGTTNKLKSGEGNAGIYVPEKAELTINPGAASGTSTILGNGILEAESYFGGAGIGGDGNGAGVSAGTITINGGNIKATGGAGGAGIGGYKGGGAGVITINKGTVNAFGGQGRSDSGDSEGAPGIGNGSSGAMII